MLYFVVIFPLFASMKDAETGFLDDATLRAHENSIPYLVSIEKTMLRKTTTNNQCTGMLVSFSWVSTSCVCLWRMNKEDGLFTWPPAILFRLLAGVTHKASKFADIRFAIKILYHEKCDLELKTMDVALMMANYPFSPNSFKEGKLIPFPVASQQAKFLEQALDTFIRRRLTCAIFGWPSLSGRKVQFVVELNVVMVKDEECGEIACSYAPGLCDVRNANASENSKEYKNRASDSKGIGFVCAKTINSWPPCTGFEGAPLVCGTNVWASVTAVKPCNETSLNGTILMTRLDVQLDFLKSKISRCRGRAILFYSMSFIIVAITQP